MNVLVSTNVIPHVPSFTWLASTREVSINLKLVEKCGVA